MPRISAKAQNADETEVQQVIEPVLTAQEPALLGSPSKKARLVYLLRQSDGASSAAISAELGWLAHITRAAITGLRKVGYQVETRSGVRGTVYRIPAEPPAMASVGKAE